MGLLDAAAFTGKLVVKTGLVVTGVALKVAEEGAKIAISKGITPDENYIPGKASGIADSIFDFNKKIKLFNDKK